MYLGLKATVEIGGGTSEGIDVIFENDENVWSPSIGTLPPTGSGEGQLILDIDLGIYQIITGVNLINANPGITSFSLSGTNLVDIEEVLFQETQISDGEQRKYELQHSKLMQLL